MQLVNEWLDEARASNNYAASTLRTYTKRAETFIAPGIGSVRIREVTVSKLDRFVKVIIKNHGPGSARTLRSVLINAFDLATRHGLTDMNLAKNTAPVPATRTTPDAPDVDTIRRLMAHLEQHDKALKKAGRDTYIHDLATLYAATAARTAECLAINLTSVTDTVEEMWVTIEATMIVNEEGKLERQKYTKTDAGMRRLRIPKVAADMIRDRRVKAYNEKLFPSSTGTYRWPHNVRRDWREAVEKTEFEKITPKSFRKAVATLLRDEKGITAASAQLGHSDERVTKKHYAKRVSDAPDMSETLGKFFQSAG